MSDNLKQESLSGNSYRFLDVGNSIQIFSILGMYGLIGVWIVEALAIPNSIWIALGLMTPSVVFFLVVTLIFSMQSLRSKKTIQEDI